MTTNDPSSRIGNATGAVDTANAIRQLADEFAYRTFSTDQLTVLHAAVAQARDLARQGAARPLANRAQDFSGEMAKRVPEPALGEDHVFVHFLRSPYSGPMSPLAPRDVTVWRRGDTVMAEVVLGSALEGAPGRAHGGAVAAVFDDIMGAVQRITGRMAFTRTLSVRYLAPFPVDDAVEITAYETEVDDRFFTAVAEARHRDRLVATAEAVFTQIGPEGFDAVGGLTSAP
ncbi:MAG: PaaI family thioesterase [Acidimicrobiales bacterium]